MIDRSNGKERQLITICIPVYNEEDNIRTALSRLRNVAKENSRYDFEFLFTDNSSIDSTYDVLKDEALTDERIRIIRFSRNFGFQKSILMNYLNARGDAAIQIDCDMQDPPELITRFLAEWERGYLVVYGVRSKRKESYLVETARKIFYRVVNQLSEVYVPPDAGDFRLIDRRIIEHLRHVTDQSPYIRGVISSLGYRQIGVPYEREERTAGYSKFPSSSMLKLAIDGICSQSIQPLHFITRFGFIMSLVAALAAIIYLIIWLLGGTSRSPGFITLVLLNLLSIGFSSAFMGIIGEYVGRVFNNVRGQPIAVVESVFENGVEREFTLSGMKVVADP